MLFATGLISGNDGRCVSLRGCITQRLTETALTELIGAAEELDRIIDVEWSQQKLHGPIMLVAQREDVAPHGPSLALAAKQNLRSQSGYSIYHRSGCGSLKESCLNARLKTSAPSSLQSPKPKLWESAPFQKLRRPEFIGNHLEEVRPSPGE